MDKAKLHSLAVLGAGIATFTTVNNAIKQNLESTGPVTRLTHAVGRYSMAAIAAAAAAKEVGHTFRELREAHEEK